MLYGTVGDEGSGLRKGGWVGWEASLNRESTELVTHCVRLAMWHLQDSKQNERVLAGIWGKGFSHLLCISKNDLTQPKLQKKLCEAC